MSRPEFQVTCLCAEWCDTCTAYRAGFFDLAARFPQARFAWLDIEDDAEKVGDLEVENFPTLLVRRGDRTLFYGPLLPMHQHLSRLLEELLAA
jgi:hypothetical protein